MGCDNAAVSLWLLLALHAAPVDARFVLDVAGTPVAQLHVGARGDTYFYEATHFFEESTAPVRLERALSAGTPEVWALLTPPAVGCHDVVEERTGKLEKLCVATRTATRVTGSIDVQRFDAEYRDGALQRITVGSATWRAVKTAVKPGATNPFAAGLAVPEGNLALSPPVAGAKWLSTTPRGVGRGDDVQRARCLVLAREAAARQRDATVVVGLVVENGRAWPHAWLSTNEGMVDPSVLAGDEAPQRRYLLLPTATAGATFLALFNGALKLTPSAE